MSRPKIQAALIMAGGTGGHVFPALAVAEALREQGINVHWLGTRNGIEARVVPAAGFGIAYLNVQGLRGHGILRWVLAPFKLIYATYEAMKVCLHIRPGFVLGMGGFVTGPGGLATKLLARPLVLHEQNAIPGMTNKLLSRIANRVLEAFPGAFPASTKVYQTGNPVRKSICAIGAPDERYAGREAAIRILVIGGSLGAQALNETVPEAIALLEQDYALDIWHQAGRQKLETTETLYSEQKVKARVVEFIDDMDKAYGWADLVICRAGAMTISEISNVGLASILVPYPYAVDDHQTANARYLSDEGAAILIQQNDLSPERLATEIRNLIAAGRDRLLTMANKAFSLARPDATQAVMQHCLEVAR